jgi:hypothetical protein
MTSDIRSIAPATGSDFTRANCHNNAREASAFIGLPRFSKTCRNSRSVKLGHRTEIAVRFAVADLLWQVLNSARPSVVIIEA